MTSDKTSAAILAIRTKAGFTGDNCPSCTRKADAPYRVYDQHGKVRAGCIDAFHSGATLVGESSFWHNRAESKKLRTKTLQHLRSL